MMKSIDRDGFACSSETVSYTHLDVYKRQVFELDVRIAVLQPHDGTHRITL